MNIPFKRKREGKTDYKKRMRLISSGKPRLVVRKTNKNVIIQMIKFDMDGDRVLVSAHTNELKEYGWKGAKSNIAAAYLAGMLCGLKAKKNDIKEAVLDTGMSSVVKGSVIYAALKGVLDTGLNVPHSEEVLPPADRLSGKHIESNTVTKFTKFNPKDITKNFDEVKKNIIEKV